MSVTSAFCEHLLYYTSKLLIVGNFISFSLLYNQGEEEKTPLDFKSSSGLEQHHKSSLDSSTLLLLLLLLGACVFSDPISLCLISFS